MILVKEEDEILYSFQELEDEMNRDRESFGLDFYVYMQRDTWDCGIACIATVLQIGYKKILEDFLSKNKRTKHGLSYKGICEYLRSKDITVGQPIHRKKINFKQLDSIGLYREKWYLAIMVSTEHGETHIVTIRNNVLICPLFGLYCVPEDMDDYLNDSGFDSIKYITELS